MRADALSELEAITDASPAAEVVAFAAADSGVETGTPDDRWNRVAVLRCPNAEDQKGRVLLGMGLDVIGIGAALSSRVRANDGNIDPQVAVVAKAAVSEWERGGEWHPDVKVEEIQAKAGNGVLDLGAGVPAHGEVEKAALLCDFHCGCGCDGGNRPRVRILVKRPFNESFFEMSDHSCDSESGTVLKRESFIEEKRIIWHSAVRRAQYATDVLPPLLCMFDRDVRPHLTLTFAVGRNRLTVII
jgi:hypothetical protein